MSSHAERCGTIPRKATIHIGSEHEIPGEHERIRIEGARQPDWTPPSPRWLSVFVIGTSLSVGMCIAPRSEVIVKLACLSPLRSQYSGIEETNHHPRPLIGLASQLVGLPEKEADFGYVTVMSSVEASSISAISSTQRYTHYTREKRLHPKLWPYSHFPLYNPMVETPASASYPSRDSSYDSVKDGSAGVRMEYHLGAARLDSESRTWKDDPLVQAAAAHTVMRKCSNLVASNSLFLSMSFGLR
jgi:hypothetical protein